MSGSFSPFDHPGLFAERAPYLSYCLSRHRVLTQAGVYSSPPCLDGSAPSAILDIGCGPGMWALEVASQFPTTMVTGIDRNRVAIEYACSQALRHGVRNATFAVMGADLALTFPDHTFDVVRGSFLVSLLVLENWLPLLRECVRITRPGGIMCLIEPERGSSTSPALEELTALTVLALKLAGHGGTPDGRMLGIPSLLSHFLRQVGCENVQCHMHAIEYAHDAPLYLTMREHVTLAWLVLEPFLLNYGLITPPAFQKLYNQMQADLNRNEFCGLWSCTTVWGSTPRAARE